jgi:hypothetical protein
MADRDNGSWPGNPDDNKDLTSKLDSAAQSKAGANRANAGAFQQGARAFPTERAVPAGRLSEHSSEQHSATPE